MKDWKTYAIIILSLWCVYLTWRTTPKQITLMNWAYEHAEIKWTWATSADELMEEIRRVKNEPEPSPSSRRRMRKARERKTPASSAGASLGGGAAKGNERPTPATNR